MQVDTLGGEEGVEVLAQRPGRVAEVVTGFVEAVRSNEGMRRTIAQEGAVAVREFTSGDGVVQPRLVEKYRSILEAEVVSGAFTPTAPLDELAYALVRVSEACVYLDLLVDQRPDLDRVARMIRAVIH